MGRTFATDRLETQGFPERLRAFLEEVRTGLNARWLGLAELSVEDGILQPIWSGTAGGEVPLVTLALGDMELLGAAAPALSEQVLGMAGLASALGASFTVVRLAVTPQLAGFDDSLLFIAHVGPAPEASILAELAESLSVALSQARRARFACTLYSAVEQAGDAIELSDREGRLFFVNHAWEKLTGFDSGEVLGRTAGQLLREPDAPLHDAAFYQFTMAELHAGRPWLGALSGRGKDGQRFFAEVHVAPFSTSVEGVSGHVAVRRNLSHRSQRDAALAMAHREFRAVLSSITDGATVVREGRIYFANAAFTAIVGRTEEQVIGRAYADFIHPEDREQFLKEHERGVTRVRVSPQAGPPRFVEISSAGAISFEGKPATIVLSRDTTDYQLAREELSRSEKLSALGSLAAGVAHEINNPLAYVALNLDLLRSRAGQALDVENRDALDEAIEGVRRMREIASELRTFTGSDRPGPPEPVDVAKAITSALNIAQNEIRQRAQIVRDFRGGAYVLAREGAIVQVLVNVLVNAAQAITAPSIDNQWIRVSVEESEASVEIVVTDTGSGIPKSVLPHLFDPFSTSKRRGEGSGLGLAICRRIVQGFGGRILVSSTVGTGTSVSIELPRSTGSPSLAPLSPGIRRVTGRRLRVLVVDDERLIVRVLTRVLEGHEIVVADDGAVALKTLEQSEPFDVILCDLMMPRLPGPQFYAEACRLQPRLASRFVFMTGGAITPSSKDFLRNFPGGVLWKPFDPWTALERIEQAARRAEGGAAPALQAKK